MCSRNHSANRRRRSRRRSLLIFCLESRVRTTAKTRSKMTFCRGSFACIVVCCWRRGGSMACCVVACAESQSNRNECAVATRRAHRSRQFAVPDEQLLERRTPDAARRRQRAAVGRRLGLGQCADVCVPRRRDSTADKELADGAAREEPGRTTAAQGCKERRRFGRDDDDDDERRGPRRDGV